LIITKKKLNGLLEDVDREIFNGGRGRFCEVLDEICVGFRRGLRGLNGGIFAKEGKDFELGGEISDFETFLLEVFID